MAARTHMIARRRLKREMGAAGKERKERESKANEGPWQMHACWCDSMLGRGVRVRE